MNRAAARVSRIALLVLSTALVPPVRAQEKGTGPATLVVSYQCKPENRVAFRAWLSGKGVSQLESWKKEGVVKDYQLLFSSFVNNYAWDAMAILQFDRYTDMAKWRQVERTMPGGLSPEALALGAPVNTYVMDLTWSGAAKERDPSKAVYFVIPYSYNARQEYKNYVEAYVVPQLQGWLAAGNTTAYSIYLNQNETGQATDVYFILEYKDLEQLALRRATISRVRAGLAANPAWKKISDAKSDFRKEGEIVIADPILPR
jgi:L-rhamnose mutarotase